MRFHTRGGGSATAQWRDPPNGCFVPLFFFVWECVHNLSTHVGAVSCSSAQNQLLTSVRTNGLRPGLADAASLTVSVTEVSARSVSPTDVRRDG